MAEKTYLIPKDADIEQIANKFRKIEKVKDNPAKFAEQFALAIAKMKAAGAQEDTILLEFERIQKSCEEGTFSFAAIVWSDGEEYVSKVFVEGRPCRTCAIVAGAQMLAELQYQLNDESFDHDLAPGVPYRDLEDEPCHDEGYSPLNNGPLHKH